MSYASEAMIADEEREPTYPGITNDVETTLQTMRALEHPGVTLARILPVDDTIRELAVDRPFRPGRDLPALIQEARLAGVDVDNLRLREGVVVAALAATSTAEKFKRVRKTPFGCPSCPCSFDWAGALFVHLIACKPFAAMLEADLAVDADGRPFP